jgi:predicted nucleic acid-binding protein
MTEQVLIDTSAWIWALRVDGPVAARQEVEQLLATGRAVTTPIVILELLSGTRSRREFQELKEDLEALQQLEPTPSVWERAYRLGYDLRRAGLTLPTVDVLLAALALEYGCLLLHADRHFEQIAQRSPLRAKGLLS